MIVTFLLAVVASVATSALVTVYGGMAAVLGRMARRAEQPLTPRQWTGAEAGLPSVTVLIPARNEADVIERRILNALDTEYPADLLEVLVIADGCSDGTADIVRSVAAYEPRVKLHDFPEGCGRHAGQNLAARLGTGDVLISTDAGTAFDRLTIPRLAVQFTDAEVGVAGGMVVFGSSGTSIGDEYVRYRDVEYRLREAESTLGVLVKTDGACTAFRRELWREIEPFEDVDHVICIFARAAGRRAVFVGDAVARDAANETRGQEIRSRSRMTRKGLLSHHHRRDVLVREVDRRFLAVFVLHRVLRVLSPVWLALAALSAIALAVRTLPSRALVGLLAAVGLVALAGRRLPRLSRPLGSFLAAQVGFGLGLLQLLRGDRTGTYEPIRHRK